MKNREVKENASAVKVSQDLVNFSEVKFKFTNPELRINGRRISTLTRKILTDDLGFREAREENETAVFYKLNSYVQFDEQNEVMFAFSKDHGVIFSNLNLSIDQVIDSSSVNKSNWYETELGGFTCNATSVYDEMDNTITVYAKNWVVVGITYSSNVLLE
jgi:hypothetical protein